MKIPYSWVTYCEANIAFGRWDQLHLARIFAGEEWTVDGVEFVEIPWRSGTAPQVVVLPAGHYKEHGCWRRIMPKLNWDLSQVAGGVLIITSDEGSTFPVEELKLPDGWILWVQWPDPERSYPPGTRFIPEGSPWSSAQIAAIPADKPILDATDLDVFFSGQINHGRRRQLMKVLDEWLGDEVVVGLPQQRFAGGLPPESFYQYLRSTKIAPCPSGHVTQSSFRVWESLECGVLPVVDAIRPDSVDNGYWDFAFKNFPLHQVADWRNLPALVSALLNPSRPGSVERETALAVSWWQRMKRSMTRGLVEHIALVSDVVLDERITVLIPTSPSPLHPDTSMILETIQSVRDRLPTAEIFIMADGVRSEQRRRFADYWTYVRDLTRIVSTMPNVMVIAHRDHKHQGMMTWDALKRVRSEFILFVEHDTPLMGEIDFDAIADTMLIHDLNLMRFHYSPEIHPDHAPLFLETEPPEGRDWIRTMQWSQRPHLARYDFYVEVIARYFSQRSRTMIEDVMHGVLANAFGMQTQTEWEAWRLAVYAPEGGYQRSGHLDGRRDDPKYPMLIDYPGDKPEGAPSPGLHG